MTITEDRRLSPSGYELRPYQEETVQAIQNAWTEGISRPAAVLATGLGKTVIFSSLIAQAHAQRRRALVLVHREELADQARRKIHSVVPSAVIGTVKAEQDDWADADVVVASVQTLSRMRRLQAIPSNYFGVGIVDEAHHAVADTWHRVMDHFGAFRGTRWAGFTATMARGDSRALGTVWQRVVAEYGTEYGIANGWLVLPRGIRVQVADLMLDEVRRSRGDFTDSDLGRALRDADAGQTIATAYREHGCREDGSLRPGALFAPSIDAAYAFASDLRDCGIRTEVVTGDTSTYDRSDIYARFAAGRIDLITSCMVLTEGWDAPHAEVAIMARPTTLAHLYVQMVGRVLRPSLATGKSSALVLDVVGVTERHRLASLVDLLPQFDPYGDKESVERHDPDASTIALPPQSGQDGEITYTVIDLFQARPSNWLRTTSGVMFIPTRTSYFFVWPRATGGWAVGRKGTVSPRRIKPDLLADDLTLEGAIYWADRLSLDEDPTVSQRRSSWRRKRPSPKMVEYAQSLGLPVTDDLKAGDLSDLITVTRADAVLPRLPEHLRVA